MKNLITQIACTTILLAFTMSYISLQSATLRILEIRSLLNLDNSAVFQQEVVEKVCEIAKCQKNDIKFDMDNDNMIIVIPIKDYISPAKFWDISAEDNYIPLKIKVKERKTD